MKKLQQMLEEEEKMRIPVAQGLPWTTDEPEVLSDSFLFFLQCHIVISLLNIFTLTVLIFLNGVSVQLLNGKCLY